MLYRYILGMCHDEYLAEDIVQTCFLKAIEHIDQFKGDAKFTTRLFQIAKHTYMDILRENTHYTCHWRRVLF